MCSRPGWPHSGTQSQHHTAAHSGTQRYTAAHSITQRHTAVHSGTQRHTATQWHTATHSGTQQHTVTRRHTATQQHTAALSHSITQLHTAAHSFSKLRQFVTRKGEMQWLGLRWGNCFISVRTQQEHRHRHGTQDSRGVDGSESCVPLVSPANAGTGSSVVCVPDHMQQRPSLTPLLSVHSNELPGRCCWTPCATTSISWRATTSAWSSLTTKRSW